MKHLLWPALFFALLAMGHVAIRPAQAFPEPSLVQRSWQFEFTHSEPRPIGLRLEDGSVQWYWYIAYKVVNKTGNEQAFVPEFTVATDKGDVVIAGRNVPHGVFDLIRKRERNDLLERPQEVPGKILQGEDFAKESVAVWPAFAHDVDHLTIFVGGLSGETAVITDPRTNEEIILRKTYQVDYATPGTDTHPRQQSVRQISNKWVMR